jgi:hypothetical protein
LVASPAGASATPAASSAATDPTGGYVDFAVQAVETVVNSTVDIVYADFCATWRYVLETHDCVLNNYPQPSL